MKEAGGQVAERGAMQKGGEEVVMEETERKKVGEKGNRTGEEMAGLSYLRLFKI